MTSQYLILRAARILTGGQQIDFVTRFSVGLPDNQPNSIAPPKATEISIIMQKIDDQINKIQKMDLKAFDKNNIVKAKSESNLAKQSSQQQIPLQQMPQEQQKVQSQHQEQIIPQKKQEDIIPQQTPDQADVSAQLNQMIKKVIGAELDKKGSGLYNISMAGHRFKVRRSAQLAALQYATTLTDPSEKKAVIDAVLVSLSKEHGDEITRLFSRGRSRLEDLITTNITSKDVYKNTAEFDKKNKIEAKQNMLKSVERVSQDFLNIINALGEKPPEPKQPEKPKQSWFSRNKSKN